MKVHTKKCSLQTEGFCDIHDVTHQVVEAVAESGFERGLATVMVPGATAGVTTIEYEEGVLEDLKKAIERMAPEEIPYAHDRRWGDGNGFSHVRAAMIGPSLTVPFGPEGLVLGTWQQIVLLDFDNRPRKRRFLVQVLGEGKRS
ncbi:MAG TPA: YjbQ family protein [Planctomycetes bacterium]|nr:YjbQ family protein [Planctomycetota bacterium]